MDGPMPERLAFLLNKATNVNNSELDLATIDAFCCAVKNEPSVAGYATKILADKIQSPKKNEALNALNLLEECMAKGGTKFQNTVGTFRFLNELVKMVSPKYLGSATDAEVKAKILDLLLLWKVQYPNESKVREAYEMLCKQGVQHEQPMPVRVQKATPSSTPSSRGSDQPKDSTSEKIKQLIQSKNPDRVDIHAANLLIQNYFEIENRKLLRVQEIKKGRENVTVLLEMLDHFDVALSSADELALIRELYETCKNLQPTILLLTEEQNQDVSVMQEALETNDLLMHAIARHDQVILGTAPDSNLRPARQSPPPQTPRPPSPEGALIDMRVRDDTEASSGAGPASPSKDNLAMLEDIFGSNSMSQQPPSVSPTATTTLIDDTHILQPQSINHRVVVKPEPKAPTTTQSVSQSKMDIDLLVSEMLKSNLTPSQNSGTKVTAAVPAHDFEGITFPNLDTIEPSDVAPPMLLLDQDRGLKVIFNFTKEHPKPNVAVIVATVANHSAQPMADVELRVEPGADSKCAVRHLMPADDSCRTTLAGAKPFRAAVDDLNQIVLVSNPERTHIVNWHAVLRYSADGREVQETRIAIPELPNLF